MSGFYSKYGFDDFNYLLSKVIPQETYRGYQLRQIGINTYQFGIKTGTK